MNIGMLIMIAVACVIGGIAKGAEPVPLIIGAVCIFALYTIPNFISRRRGKIIKKKEK